jgi:pimeloyl-ACP methyl ester carboxylesterase
MDRGRPGGEPGRTTTRARIVASQRSFAMPSFRAADGTSLHYREWGDGAPMLFLNSLGASTRMWDYQFAAFAERRVRCIGLDRRGHGRSDEPAFGYDHDTLADDVAGLIDHLDLSGLTVVAHSMAGGEVARYLSRHGQGRVARIVLVGAMTPCLLQGPDNPLGLPGEAFEALWAQWGADYPQWVADNVGPFFVPETSRAMMDWAEGFLLTASVPVSLACSRSMVAEDFRAEMRRIEVPTLVIHGERDRSAPLELTGRPTAALIPGARLVVYEGAPHGLMFTHMARLQADILGFLREAR